MALESITNSAREVDLLVGPGRHLVCARRLIARQAATYGNWQTGAMTRSATPGLLTPGLLLP